MTIVNKVSSFEEIKVQVVTSFPELLVYSTNNKLESKGNDVVSFFDTSIPKKKIRLITSFPDLKIPYVNSKSQAGWKNRAPKLQHRIG